jgi:hypothetical protein
MSITKKSFFAVIFLALFSVSAFASQFCDGFAQGYVTGYKQTQGTSLAPLVPLCPLQPLKGFGDPQSDFEHGYTIGFKQGTADGSR